ncbi:hypothetical protein HK103_006374 [Boothiomyces macroporosus]|uniref:Uncharacterized protein n=1 Tax=Boothiomyces macroporosus TaxID=261099 RepID=A0AAD5UDN9_9FUNG|nr:hypothetical protein HK103_006374 [Boothiomyces macroporosus]
MERIFERFDSYDFDKDERFQKGKASLAGDILQIKHFYYSKYFEKFDFQEYLDWKKPKEQKLSFQDIMEKIQKGEEIPGIKQIPNTVHETSSSSNINPIKKPWEQ